jgi:hypothetical protein
MSRVFIFIQVVLMCHKYGKQKASKEQSLLAFTTIYVN